ncbi:MBL fold metallo-hydrolase [Tenacibaculum sp. 1B UA]|uniref:MBL fold metallo-hydrolase n=1 Tax=unclassified Tenacibaculum TaxID=2635139 RepID=UPI0026E2D1B7|nr:MULTISPECIES: MBL fold metallo-hydrolase [unclassified Tenacibaculum]MDO6675873.1 MBL fold metallo-hydrolase [Tenacibaculum sp. 1_MG-2023]MDX8553964.1 MBL fold metallo-hydrolase [Tenacibaculum sp. 1B UA]
MLHIHQIRNATIIIETEKEVILVDPMLGNQGIMPSFTLFRHKARKNPTVPLPIETHILLKKVTHCLITHQHPDHIDNAGVQFLIKNNIPVTCSVKDEKAFKKRGLNIVQSLKYWEKQPFLGGEIEGIPAKHGYGFVAKLMGNVLGFYIKLPNKKTIYLSSDTIYTDAVHNVLTNYKPDVNVLACGAAQFDVFKQLIMSVEDILQFIKNSSGLVIANHMEAINHCPLTRKKLKIILKQHNLLDKTSTPEDGETVFIN